MARWERQIAWKGMHDLPFPGWHGPPEMPSSDRAVGAHPHALQPTYARRRPAR